MTLDIQKVEMLYYEIAHNQYMYSDDENSYYKLTVAMDRIKHTVDLLNKFNLMNGNWNEDATEFLLWINYADIFIAAMDIVAAHFSYALDCDKQIFLKYHGLTHKSDKDFFRFVRAIVLPHALKLDDKSQKEFTNGQTAYCPFVVWDSHNHVRIVYYNADVKNDLHQYTIAIDDFEKYLSIIYNQIDDLIKVVKKRKTRRKSNDKCRINNEKYNKEATLKAKITFLRELTIKYGDLDDKAGNSVIIHTLNRCNALISMKFSGKNKIVYDEYKKYLNFALDDYYNYLCSQSENEILLKMMLMPYHDHTSRTDFDGLGYEVNKICFEMENFDDFVQRYYFDEYYEALKPVLSQKIYVSKKMSMERICYLTIMAFFFDRLKYRQEYKKAFSGCIDE